MRILYLYNLNATLDSGVVKKIDDQCHFLSVNGVQVFKFNIHSVHFGDLWGVVNRFLFSFELWRLCRRERIQVIYVRYSFLPLFNFVLDSRTKIVLELNSNYNLELRRYRYLKWLLSKWYYQYLTRRSNVLIQISNSCTKEDFFAFKKYTIGNSIKCKLEDIPVSKKENLVLRKFLFLGNPNAPWHGIDVILDFFCYDVNLFDELHIVGYSEADLPSFVSSKIFIHGQLFGQELEKVIRHCDVGVGSMRMDLIGMNSSSSLKNKEYLRHGLFVILQGVDADISHLKCVFSMPMEVTPQLFWESIDQLRVIGDFDPNEVYCSIASDILEVKRLNILKSVV